jgi:hypothetical protein
MVDGVLGLFMRIVQIERPFGFHVQILRRSRNRSSAVKIKLHHYRWLRSDKSRGYCLVWR